MKQLFPRAAAELSNRFQPYVCDLADPNQIKQVFAEIYKQNSHVDILVNNAGVVFAATLGEQTRDEIEKTFAINAMSHFYTIQTAMLTHGFGKKEDLEKAGADNIFDNFKELLKFAKDEKW